MKSYSKKNKILYVFGIFFLIGIAVLVGVYINFKNHNDYGYALKQTHLVVNQIGLNQTYGYTANNCGNGKSDELGGGTNDCALVLYVFAPGSGNKQQDEINLEQMLKNAGFVKVDWGSLPGNDGMWSNHYYKPTLPTTEFDLSIYVDNLDSPTNSYDIPSRVITATNNIKPYAIGYIWTAGYAPF